jgi:hypothetical protein
MAISVIVSMQADSTASIRLNRKIDCFKNTKLYIIRIDLRGLRERFGQ